MKLLVRADPGDTKEYLKVRHEECLQLLAFLNAMECLIEEGLLRDDARECLGTGI